MNSGIVRAKYLFTDETNEQWSMLEDAGLYHRDGVVVETGRFASLREKYPDAPVLGSGNEVVLPGFINGHHHLGLTPVQHGVEDLPIELWTCARIKMRGVDPYLDTLYSAFEMVSSGITTVQHIRGAFLGTPEDIHRALDASLQAYSDLGMRVSMAAGMRDQNHVHHHLADDDLLALLPGELRSHMAEHLGRFRVDLDGFFGVYEQMRSAWKDNPLVAVQLAPINLQWMSDKSLQMHADYVAHTGTLLHIHLDETPYQREYARRRGGGSSLDYLNRYGMVDHKLTLGHGVWLTRRDIECLAGAGGHVCHNCSSNLRLRSGIAPVNHFHRMGVNVAIGIDEAGLNDDRDMLQEMRLILKLHRVPGMDDEVPTPGQVLRMATKGGAATTPFGEKIGRLTAGAAADLVMIDWNAVAKPYLHPDMPILSAVIHRAKTAAVKAVLVAGRTIYEGGRFLNVDQDKILERIEEHMSRPETPVEKRLREIADRALPYIQKSYDNYLSFQRRPFHAYNSST